MKKTFNKTFALALSALMVSSVFMPIIGSAASNDYESHWAKATIQTAIDQGTVKGYPDGSFRPDASITRAEFFEMVNKEFKFTKESSAIYADVAKTAWYAPVVEKANAAGYISGYMDGTIHPNDRISRQEVAVVLNRLNTLSTTSSLLSFADASMVPSWSKDAIIAVFESKVMVGYPDGKFMPEAQITRAETLAALINCHNYQASAQTPDLVYSLAGSYGPSGDAITIAGNVLITAPGVTLKNVLVKGNVTIAKEVGEGSVTLKNVTVKGNTYVNGGTVDSIHFENVIAENVIVLKDAGPVGLIVSGTSVISQVTAVSDLKLQETNLTGAGFEGITVDKDAPNGTYLTLVNVQCKSVHIIPEGTELNVDKTSIVDSLEVDGANTRVAGTGVITSSVLNGTNTTFEDTLTH